MERQNATMTMIMAGVQRDWMTSNTQSRNDPDNSLPRRDPVRVASKQPALAACGNSKDFKPSTQVNSVRILQRPILPSTGNSSFSEHHSPTNPPSPAQRREFNILPSPAPSDEGGHGGSLTPTANEDMPDQGNLDPQHRTIHIDHPQNPRNAIGNPSSKDIHAENNPSYHATSLIHSLVDVAVIPVNNDPQEVSSLEQAFEENHSAHRNPDGEADSQVHHLLQPLTEEDRWIEANNNVAAVSSNRNASIPLQLVPTRPSDSTSEQPVARKIVSYQQTNSSEYVPQQASGPIAPSISPRSSFEDLWHGVRQAYTAFHVQDQSSVVMQRMLLLEAACKKGDMLLLIIHRIYCMNTFSSNRQGTAQAEYTFAGGSALKQILATNDSLSLPALKWFSAFPQSHPDHKPSYDLAQTCLDRLETSWVSVARRCYKRLQPPVISELEAELGIKSVILQRAAYLSVSRSFWGTRDDDCLEHSRLLFEQFQQAWAAITGTNTTEYVSAGQNVLQQFQNSYQMIWKKHCTHRGRGLKINLDPPNRPSATSPSAIFSVGSSLNSSARQSHTAGPSRAQNNSSYAQYASRQVLPSNSSTPSPRPPTDAFAQGTAPFMQAQSTPSRRISPYRPFSSTIPTQNWHAQGTARPQASLPIQMNGPSPMTHTLYHGQSRRVSGSPLSNNHQPLSIPEADSTHMEPFSNAEHNPASLSAGAATVQANLPSSGTVDPQISLSQLPSNNSNAPSEGVSDFRLPSLFQSHFTDPSFMVNKSVDGYGARTSFLYFKSLIVKLTLIPEARIHHLSFELSKGIFGSLATSVKGEFGISKPLLMDIGKRSIRLRAIKCPPGSGEVDERNWVVHETVWPALVSVRVNGIHLHVRRQLQYGKDLPLDLSETLREGPNDLEVAILPSSTTNRDERFILGIENIEMIDSSKAREDSGFLPEPTVKAQISDKLRWKDPDISIVDEHLTLSLIDPISLTLIQSPVRGIDCVHLQCFDLDAFLASRQTAEEWPVRLESFRCPICDGDARPQSLVTDQWLQNVLAEIGSEIFTEPVTAVVVDGNANWSVRTGSQGGSVAATNQSITATTIISNSKTQSGKDSASAILLD
ncbi:Zinc finger MIZ domain-containing protein 1 [Agyrium rufum]|nr:Zinc finger MIZ domain-containing protein 1 [Agyrium rufum]